MLPEVKLVLAKLQVFSFTLLDLLVSADLGEKRVFSSGFLSFLLGKLVGNLQVSSIFEISFALRLLQQACVLLTHQRVCSPDLQRQRYEEHFLLWSETTHRAVCSSDHPDVVF